MQGKPLAPGLYWRMWPWQYAITMEQFTVIPQDKLGLVKAKDGAPMDSGRVLGKPVPCKSVFLMFLVPQSIAAKWGCSLPMPLIPQ